MTTEHENGPRLADEQAKARIGAMESILKAALAEFALMPLSIRQPATMFPDRPTDLPVAIQEAESFIDLFTGAFANSLPENVAPCSAASVLAHLAEYLSSNYQHIGAPMLLVHAVRHCDGVEAIALGGAGPGETCH